MELKVQGHLLEGEGILGAVLARADEDVTEFDIIGREDELMRQLGENVVMPLYLLEDLLKPIKETIVTINPNEEDDTLAVQVKIIFEDGSTYETREVLLGVASFDLREIYRELFLPQIESEGGRNYTVVYHDYRNVLDPFNTPPCVEFDGRLYNVSRYCEEYKQLEKKLDREDESRLRECLYEAAVWWWNSGGLKCLKDELDTLLRFADYWHVQHYKGKYWYAFLLMDGDIMTTGDVFGGERICAPFAIDIPWHLLSDAVKQDIKTMEKIFENQLCAIGCDAVEMFQGD